MVVETTLDSNLDLALVQIAITEYHKLPYKQQEFISHSSGS